MIRPDIPGIKKLFYCPRAQADRITLSLCDYIEEIEKRGDEMAIIAARGTHTKKDTTDVANYLIWREQRDPNF